MRGVLAFLIAHAALVAPLFAQVSIPQPLDSKHADRIGMMKADLIALVQQQKFFFRRHQTYADSTTLWHLRPESRGTIRIVSAGERGWSGTLTTTGEPETSCGVFVEDAVAPNGAVIADGIPGCWFLRPDGVGVGFRRAFAFVRSRSDSQPRTRAPGARSD